VSDNAFCDEIPIALHLAELGIDGLTAVAFDKAARRIELCRGIGLPQSIPPV
jgi:hypothetical protein